MDCKPSRPSLVGEFNERTNHMKIQVAFLILAISAFTHKATAGSLSVTNEDSSRALALVQQIANDIEAMKPQFAELSEFSNSNHLSRAAISYLHNANYVPGNFLSNSGYYGYYGYYSVKQGGCIISIEAWDNNEDGWQGGYLGTNILNINQTLPNVIHIMASVHAPNDKLRKAVADTIAARIQGAK
jgi:hypothetical protein